MLFVWFVARRFCTELGSVGNIEVGDGGIFLLANGSESLL